MTIAILLLIITELTIGGMIDESKTEQESTR